MALPQTVEEILSHFPQDIPEKAKKRIREYESKYIFFRDKDDRNKGECSCCGHTVEMQYTTHNERTECPLCNEPVKVKHEWRGIKSLREELITYHAFQSIKDKNTITAIAVYTCNAWWYGRRESTVAAYYVFTPGVGAAMARAEYNYGTGRYDRYCMTKHIGRVEHRFNNKAKVASWMFKDMDRLAPKTNLRYTWAALRGKLLDGPYDAPNVFAHMCKYSRQDEWLAKMGLGEMILKNASQNNGIPAIYWGGKTVDALFRGKLSKEEKALMIEKGDEITRARLELRLKLKKFDSKITLEDVLNLKYCSWEIEEEFSVLSRYMSAKKAIRYIEKQQKKHPKEHITFRDYKDYLLICENQGADMKSKATLFPQNLAELHRQQRTRLKELEVIEKDKNSIKVLKKINKKYGNFERDGFKIVVPSKISDLVREGEEMHNCVGSYIDRVMTGKSIVVYIRHIDAIDESFGTMEIASDGKRIIQARGKYNRQLPPEAQEFVMAFEKEVLHKRRKAA